MVIFFHVKEISKSIYEELKQEKGGSVHSIYKSTINISMTEQIFSIQPHSLPKTPMCITITESSKTFDELNIKTGDKVVFYKSRFIINNHSFDISEAKLWNPKLDNLIINGKDINDKTIKFLCSLMKMYGKKEGLRDVALYLADLQHKDTFINNNRNEVVQKALPTVEKLMINILEGEIKSATQKLVDLMGMGPGLTPSGDDFLIGFLSVVLLIEPGPEIIKQLTAVLKKEIENSLDKTTFLSGQFLKYGCRKEFSETFHRFYSALEKNNSKEISASTMEFIKLGHSSGTDTLSGIVVGLLLINKLHKSF